MLVAGVRYVFMYKHGQLELALLQQKIMLKKQGLGRALIKRYI